MKSVAFILAIGLASMAQAQDQCALVAAEIPPCAASVILSAASGVGCGPTDFACQCQPSNVAAINSAALQGVISGCGPVTGLAVQASASAVCECAASATPASPETTTSSSTSISSSSSSSTPATVSSSATPATTAAPLYPTTASTTIPVATAPSASGPGSTISSSTAPFVGGAMKRGASIGGIMGACAALVAAL